MIKEVLEGYIDKLVKQEPEELVAVFLRKISESPVWCVVPLHQRGRN